MAWTSSWKVLVGVAGPFSSNGVPNQQAPIVGVSHAVGLAHCRLERLLVRRGVEAIAVKAED